MDFRKGVLFSLIAQYSSFFFQLGTGVVLSRLLSPEDFGKVAAITVIITFFNTISNLGIGAAIIYNKEIDSKDLTIYFYITVVLASILALVFIVTTYYLDIYYFDNDFYSMGIYLSLNVFFSTISIVPLSQLQKQGHFKKIAYIMSLAALVSGIFSIGSAAIGLGYQSLLILTICTTLVQFLGYALTAKLRTILGYSSFERKDITASFKKISQFSFYNFGFHLINYFSRNLDTLLIGRFFGREALGFYDKAYKLMQYPVQAIGPVFSPVIQAAYGGRSKEDIYSLYERLTHTLLLLGIPLSVFSYFNSEDIIYLMYGSQWGRTVPVFQVFSCTIWLQIVFNISGAFFLAAGDTRRFFYFGIYNAGVIVSSILIGVLSSDIVKLSIWVSGGYIVGLFLIQYFVVSLILKKNLYSYYRIFFKPVIIGFLMAGGFLLIGNGYFNSIFVRLLFNTLFALMVYLVGLYITGEYKLLRNYQLFRFGK